jgi:hypothetical protein
MAYNITDSMVRQYNDNLRMTDQQMRSALRNGVEEMRVVGKDASIERFTDPTQDMTAISTRHGDTVYTDMSHSRRVLTTTSYADATMIDHADMLRMLVDPKTASVAELSGRFNRVLDQRLIAAILGNAATGEAGAGTQALVNQIAAGATGLTLTKLQQARTMLIQGFVDLDREEMNLFTNAEGDEDLRTDTGLISNLNVPYQSTADGVVPRVAGFNIRMCEALSRHAGSYTGAAISSSSRPAILMAKSAVTLGISEDLNAKVDVLPAKRHSVGIAAYATFGAVRVFDERVVDIRFAE